MDTYIEDKINRTISSFGQLPYLFVGTGLSMRYAHAPNWNNLLYDIWKTINPDKKERDYKRLVQGIEMSLDTEYKNLPTEEKKYYINPILASKIEEQFCNLYYLSTEFESTIFTDCENDEIINNHYNPFKYYVAQKLSLIKLDPELPNYEEIASIVKNENKFAGIITTNYDSMLEHIFSDFSVMVGQDESITKREIIFGNTSIVINEFILNDYQKLYKAFSNIQSSMPIKLVRKLQDMVCNFVYSTETQNNIIFGDVDSPNIDDQKAAIFFGRADTVTNIGFSYFTINEILEDIIFDNKPYLIKTDLIEKTFKNIRSSAGTTLLPIYKYTAKLDYPLEKIPHNYNIIRSYVDIQPTTSERRSYIKPEYNFKKIADIENACPSHIPKQVSYIKKFAEQIETEDLGDYLRRNYGTIQYSDYSSQFKRLTALYDFKKYAPQ